MSPEAFLRAAAPPPDELRERLLSFMVHEIRNPLATALWSAEMLARQTTGDARRDRLAGLAVRSVRRLRVLLEDLFALERLGPPPTRGRGVRLSQALDRAISPHDLEPTGIPVVREPVSGDPVVPLDPLLLDRLLSACLRRALHAGEGGSIRLAVETVDALAIVHVVRVGATVGDVDPPLLTPGGGEGEGTTFTLLVARVAALRLGVTLSVEPTPGGVELRVALPTSTDPAP
jgi:signal transduction histidine kinase